MDTKNKGGKGDNYWYFWDNLGITAVQLPQI